MTLINFDRDYLKHYSNVIGIDEVGRGCLAGPLVICAIIMKTGFVIPDINDSKKLSAKKRELLYNTIIDNCLSYKIIEVDIDIIDKINIYQATKQAMEQAATNLYIENSIVLSDAMLLTNDVPKEAIIKGDTKSYSIACASIIAKVYRDRLMIDMDKIYPQYDFINNKGYGTKKHLAALKEYGYIECVHRKSFEPIKSMSKDKVTLF